MRSPSSSLGETASLFGLDRAAGRLIPSYLEKRDYARAFGVIGLALATVSSIGAALVALVLLACGEIQNTVINDHRAVTLLVLILALAPIQDLEDLAAVYSASWRAPRTIFFRAYRLEPSLALGSCALADPDAQQRILLAVGYFVAGAIGLTISTRPASVSRSAMRYRALDFSSATPYPVCVCVRAAEGLRMGAVPTPCGAGLSDSLVPSSERTGV
jgi:hypothetical protein